ncbi:c-type cytochrome [Leptospira neocaledonica]|uniref:Cytochrome c domain-containing protein n=1 Tax=Leptospira neocaledonica TaxID=2023192 RepID=A0A2M9ZTB2_9LEPT|nr:cytochrome c [Leptospira neocaledonica]PJZ75317.1 hypothetical protein CH365_19545 [Leptospira neocaledonica]
MYRPNFLKRLNTYLINFMILMVISNCDIFSPKKEQAQIELTSTSGRVGIIRDGKTIYKESGCELCHSLNGERLVGPPLNGIYGRTITLNTGEKITGNFDYIKESILDPNKLIVSGYPPAMPNYTGRITADEMEKLINYIRGF